MTEILYCVELNLPADKLVFEDAVEGALWDFAELGIERQDDSTFSELVDEPRPRAPGSIRWRLYSPEPFAPDMLDSLRLAAPAASVEVWTLDDLSFLTSWREHFRPSQVSPRVWVHPPWDRPAVGNAVCVEIEPGMAFGTGTHPTTRLCIAAIDALCGTGTPTLIDVGCGSGVLAIAALKLGARVLAAVDNDVDAVRIANENLALNSLPELATTTGVSALDETAEIVVANILPHILIDMKSDLARLTAPSGTLVLSGIVVEQMSRVVEAFSSEGLHVDETSAEGDWRCITFVRR